MEAPASDRLKRLRQNAVYILVSLTAASLPLTDLSFTVSVLIGGGLALLNFHVLAAGVDRVLPRKHESIRLRSVTAVAGFLGRLLLILVTLFAMIHFSFLSPIGGLLGFSIIVLSGFWEAVLLLINR